MPRGRRQICSAIFGRPICSKVRILFGIWRSTSEQYALLLEDRDAEAGLVAVGEAEVARARLLELLLDALGRDRLHQRHRVLGVEHLGLQLAQVPVQAQRRRLADGQVQVATPSSADDRFEERSI